MACIARRNSIRRGPWTALLVPALLTLLGACSRETETPSPEARPVRTVTVAKRDVGETASFTGRIEAENETRLSFRIGGRMVERNANVGDQVQPGQVVAKLEPQNELNALRSAQAAVSAAQAQFNEAQANYERQAFLLKRDVASVVQYERAEQTRKTAQAQLNSADAQLKIAQDHVSDTELKADAGGVVIATAAEPGEVVQAGQLIVRIAPKGGRDAVFDVPGQALRVTPYDGTVNVSLTDDQSVTAVGRVREISPQADPVTRTFEVKVGLTDPPAAMRLGATVVGRVQFDTMPTIEIPASALTEHDRQPAVWVVDPKSSHRLAAKRRCPAAQSRDCRDFKRTGYRRHRRDCGSPGFASRPENPSAGVPIVTGFNLSEWALKHRSFVVYLMLVTIAAGVMSYLALGRNEDPAFTFRAMIVQAAWPGATLNDTLDQVTDRLEQTLKETPNLDFLRSFTRAGVTTIFVNLKGSTPPKEVPDIWYHVRKSIGDVRHTLPPGVVGPGFNDEFGDTFGIIYGFTADGFTHRELRDYVEKFRTRLLQVPDVSKIEILGAQDEQIIIEFSTETLAGLGIDRAAVIAAIQAQNAVTPAGTLETGDETLLLRVSGAFESELDLSKINIASNGRLIRLSDIAEIRRGFVDPPQPIFRISGKPGIGLAIAMREGGDILALGRNIRRTVNELTADLPIGIDATLVADQSSVVQSAIGEFMKSLWQAIAIIMAVSVVSLGLRAGAIVAISIPLTLAVVFPVMQLVNIDLQRISLGALIIALTLLVDDAMSTIDAMSMRLAAGDEKEQAATFAYKTLAFPMLTGSFVTMAGFVPIGFARSSAGEYTFSIFAVVSIAVLASWLVAVIFIPLFGVALLTKPKAQQSSEPGFVLRVFRSMVVVAMRMRWLTILVTLGCFVVALLAVPSVPRQFFPSSDRSELLVDLRLPQNASIYASMDASAKIDAILKGDPDVERWSTNVGRGAIRFYLPLSVELPNDFFSQFVIIAKDIAARERLRAKLDRVLAEEFPSAVTRSVPLELGPPVGWPVQYRVSGPDLNQVRDIAMQLAQIIATDAHTRRINFDWIEPARQVRIRIDQDQARLLGLGSESIAGVLNTVMSGTPVTQVRDSIYLVDVLMRATELATRFVVHVEELAVPACQRPDCPAGTVREFGVRPGVPDGLAPRRRADPDDPGRCHARRFARSRRRRACAHNRKIRRGLAAVLSHRRWRHRRGERAVAGLGLCRHPLDAVHHDHVPDDTAAELQPSLHGDECRAHGPDRCRGGPPAVSQAAGLRRDPRDFGADGYDCA